MSDLRIKGHKIIFKDVPLELIFNLNVMDVVSDTYPTVESMSYAIDTAKGQKVILAALINESIETHNSKNAVKLSSISEKEIGMMFSPVQMESIGELITVAFISGLPKYDVDLNSEIEGDNSGETKAE